MAATVRGEALIEGTTTKLVFDHAAIDQIEAAADRSIFDLIEEVQTAAKAKRKPKLSTLSTLLWGSYLAAEPEMTREEAFAMVVAGEAGALTAMAQALAAAFPKQEDGAGASANPPNRRARRAAAATGATG